MKYDKIRLVGAQTIDLPKDGLGPLTPYVLKAADGLGPPEVDVSIVRTLQTGGYYQGRRPQLREIIMRVGLQPEWNINQTASDLRVAFYGLLTPKTENPIKIQFMLGEVVVAEGKGYISNIEISTFSKDPEIQVTMDCLDPYFYGPTIYNTATLSVSGSATYFDVANPGTAPSGFWISLKFTTPFTASMQFSKTDAFGPRVDVLDRTFAVGDKLIIDTRPGTRNVYKVPSGTDTLKSLLGNLSTDSTWIQMHGGDNTFRLNHNGVEFDDFFKFSYTPAYWGV